MTLFFGNKIAFNKIVLLTDVGLSSKMTALDQINNPSTRSRTATHFVLAGDPGVDGDHEDDAEDDGQYCGGEVVSHGPETNFARERHV